MSDKNKEKQRKEEIIEKKIKSHVVLMDSPLIFPLVDAHMHIQSNDIAPLPIMNSILRYKASFKNLPKKKINYIEISFRQLQEKTIRYDYDPDKDIIYDNGVKIYNRFLLDSTVGFKKFDFEDREFLTNATAITQYGKVTRFCSYLIASLYLNQTVDSKDTSIASKLAFPSRWIGEKEAKEKDINKAKKKMDSLIKKREVEVFNNFFNWYYISTSTQLKTSGDVVHSFLIVPKMACIMGMELMYAHYWGGYGIPLYIKHDGKIYTIDNFPKYSLFHGYDEYGEPVYSENHLNYPYDIPNKLDIIDLKNERKSSIGNKPYSIFLKEVPDSEAYKFEDHVKHVEYQKMAALRYPLQFLLFYHVDPRRFFAPVDRINENFCFYKEYKDDGKILYKKINPPFVGNNADKLEASDFRYQISEEELEKEFISESNEKGLFWGVKLYVALGYPPYIGINSYSKKVFPLLENGDYMKFTEFLKTCAEKKIPVTCHGSPQGMTIGDSEIYLKEYLKHNDVTNWKKIANFHPNTKGLMLGLGLIDDFSSPDSWRIVLNEIKDKPINLCLAHFGGKPFFVDKYKIGDNEDKYPYSWQEKLAKLIEDFKDKHAIYTDLSNFMFKSVFFPCKIDGSQLSILLNEKYKVKELVKKYFKFDGDIGYDCLLDLNDLSNYAGDENKQKMQDALKIRFAMLKSNIVGKDINLAAENLKNLINAHKLLRHRIMYGTDYPMFEGDVKGVDNYQNATFLFYQLLTHKLDNKWDSWYQFTVINPLKFLGLLDKDDEDETACYEISEKGLEKLKNFKNNLIALNKKTIEPKRTKFWNLGEEEELGKKIEKEYENLVSKLKGKKLPNAKNIVDADNILILTGEQV